MENRIRELRKKAGLTQPELVKALSKSGITLTVGALSNYERNTRQPNDAFYETLASILHTTPNFVKGYGYSKEYLIELIKKWYFDDKPIYNQYGEKSIISFAGELNNFIRLYQSNQKSFDLSPNYSYKERDSSWWSSQLAPLFDSGVMRTVMVTAHDLTENELFMYVGSCLDDLSYSKLRERELREFLKNNPQ